MTSFSDIPNEIMVNNIAKNLDLSGIEKITSVSKTFYDQKEELVNAIINSDEFLQSYTHKDDILNIIKKSHFTPQSFLRIFDGICNRDKNAITFEFTNVETSKESIDNTFNIFQLFKCCTNIIQIKYNLQYGHLISKLLVDYFNELFKKRSGLKKFNASIIGFYFHNTNCDWHIIDINPYYIYENLNNMLQSSRSFLYRQYIENRTNILMDGEYDHQQYTLKFLMNIMNYGDISRKTYIFYEIVKYMNAIREHNIFNEKTIKACMNKIHELRYLITENIHNKIPKYFKEIVFEEFDKFLEMNRD